MNHKQASILLTAALLPLSTLWLNAADAPVTPSQAAHQEIVNRQKQAMAANQAISDGRHLLTSGNYDEAAARFQFALDNLTPGGASATSYNRAQIGLAAAKDGQAQALAKDNKFKQADDLLQQAVILQPNDPQYPIDIDQLKQEQMAYERQIRDPEGTTNNPAVTDDFRSRVAATQKLLFQGDCFFKTGQFDKAEDTYSKILILDPYNKAARDKMAHIELYKTRAASFRHEEYELKSMERVDHGWTEDISTDIVTPPDAGTKVNTVSPRVAINRKLSSIIIDKVNFEKLDIAAVIQFLQQKSKELDPDKQGINFVLRLTTDATAAPAPGAAPAPAPAPGDTTAPAVGTQPIHREVSITLTDVPLSEVLSYIVQQTNLQYSVEDYAVYLRPSIDEGENLTVRTYLVPPNFFSGTTLHVEITAPTDNAPSTVDSIGIKVQDDLANKGIRFPAGSSATFLPGSSKLVVRDTPEQLDLIANLIDQASKETPQVEIEAKIAEFNQDAIKGLTFNFTAGTGVGTARNFGAQSGLRTSESPGESAIGGLTPDGINTLIEQNTASSGGFVPVNQLTGGSVLNNAPNVFTIGATLDHTGLAIVIDALNNLQGVSLLSAPMVTTQNNLKANIDIVREFPYPTTFEKPKLSNSSNLGYSSGPFSTGFGPNGTDPAPLVLAIPPTPREFVTQDVGVSLEVKPTTYPDRRIDLDITKAQVLDFDGFVDYGVPITTRLNEDSPAPTSPGTSITSGTINQPVFNLRSMVTSLQVLDGQTAVLGGLIREDTQEINDKVPVLGDIPLLGRLFQSKVTERTKKNLIIFITARLIRSNGKPQYVRTLTAEPEEEVLPEPDSINIPGANLAPLPEGTPNS